MTQPIDISALVATIAVVTGFFVFAINYFLELKERRSAEKYIYILEEGEMKRYNEFKKIF